MKTILIMLFTAISLSVFSQDTSVVQLEYFFDTDNGFGKTKVINVTPAVDGSFPFTANIAGLSIGYHKLYIRTKDSNGKWSFTTRRNIEVFAPDTKTTIVSGEYFIDTDPGFDAGIPIAVTTPDSAILQNFTAATAGLAVGYHKLYGRFKDNLGRWSPTFRRNIEVYENDTNYVYNAEYFFKTDNGYGNCTDVKLTNPAVDGSFSFNIPRSQIPTGADTLFIRVQDSSANRWSITQIKDSVVILPLTLVSFTANKQNTTTLLKWQTVNEINVAYFIVQRSTNGVDFINVGKVYASNRGSGQNLYSFTDDITAIRSNNIYYRLQMVDNDAKFTYSKTEYITVNASGSYISLYPNPAHSYFMVSSYANMNVSNANIVVKDISGRIYLTQKLTNATEQKINIASLAKGVYLVSIVSKDGVQTQKLVVE